MTTMRGKAFLCGFIAFCFLYCDTIAASPATPIPYYSLKSPSAQKPFFQGTVERGRTVTLGFGNCCELSYVIPANTPVKGRIVNSKGKVVYKGEILATAKNKIAKLSLNIALLTLKKNKLQLQDMEEDYERVKSLYRQQVYSTKQFQDAANEYLKAKTDYEVARLQVLEAREALEQCYIRAPFLSMGLLKKVLFLKAAR